LNIFNNESFEAYKSAVKKHAPLSPATIVRASNAFSRFHQRYIDKHVFIHINKCGGTSMERALGIPLLNHDSAIERREVLGEQVWQQRYKFALVRNPYDRIDSLFRYRHRHIDANQDELIEIFPKWLDEIIASISGPNSEKLVEPQWKWISDSSGKLIIDDVYKLEETELWVNKINSKLGKTLSLKRLKKSKHSTRILDSVDSQTKLKIRQAYHTDFEKLGYE